MQRSKPRYRNYLSGDEKAIIALLASKRENRDEYYRQKQRLWQWQYISNPHQQERQPFFWICEIDSRVVGAIGLMPSLFVIDGREYRTWWGTDYIVHENYRGRWIAVRLMKLAYNSVPFSCGFNLADIAYQLLLKFNFVPISAARELVFAMRPRRLHWKEIIKWGYSRTRFKAFGGNHEKIAVTRAAEGLPEDMDRFWEKFKPAHRFLIKRDKAYLDWKYLRHPIFKYMVFVARLHGQTAGAAICRIEQGRVRKSGIIAELMATDKNRRVLAALIRAILSYFHEEQVHTVRCVSSQGYLTSTLNRCGFITHRNPLPFVVRHPDGEPYPALSRHLDQWFISGGDSDNDFSP